MNEWFSARELAEMKLPGISGSRENASRLISRAASTVPELVRKRTGRGGGREIHVTALPDEAQAEHRRRSAVTALTPASVSEWIDIKYAIINRRDDTFMLVHGGKISILSGVEVAQDGLGDRHGLLKAADLVDDVKAGYVRAFDAAERPLNERIEIAVRVLFAPFVEKHVGNDSEAGNQSRIAGLRGLLSHRVRQLVARFVRHSGGQP